jgi:hypothetical protein
MDRWKDRWRKDRGKYIAIDGGTDRGKMKG